MAPWHGNGRLQTGDGQAEVGGAGWPEPHGRGKRGSAAAEIHGTKRSVLVDGGGSPLSVVVAGANVNDLKLLGPTLKGIVVERPDDAAENLCLGKGYDNAHGWLLSYFHGYKAHSTSGRWRREAR